MSLKDKLWISVLLWDLPIPVGLGKRQFCQPLPQKGCSAFGQIPSSENKQNLCGTLTVHETSLLSHVLRPLAKGEKLLTTAAAAEAVAQQPVPPPPRER
jgi:hypothetical protein